jgi:hypothetical protein
VKQISPADDPLDINWGHSSIDVILGMACPSCRHRQEHVIKRAPFQPLSEAEGERHVLGKG